MTRELEIDKDEAINRIKVAIKSAPFLRIGQLMYNAFYPDDMFYMSDRQFIERLEEYIASIP
jgi:hypothetical protein